MSLIDAEMSRLKGLNRVLTRERDEARQRLVEVDGQREQLETLQAHAEELQFCLTQARIVLKHLRASAVDPGDRRLAEGAMIASDMDIKA